MDPSSDILFGMSAAAGEDPFEPRGSSRSPSNDDGYALLLAAAQRNNSSLVMQLLVKGVNVNSSNSSGATPLHHAVIHGNVEIVKLLVEKKAAVNAVDQTGSTPLHVAVELNNDEIVRFLLLKEAAASAADHSGCTPLHIAVERRDDDIVRLLLEKGAMVNATDHSGDTPLHVAVGRSNVEIVKMLIEKGAAVNAGNRSGCTPIHLAVDRKRIEIVKILLQSKAAVNSAATCGRTPLHRAVASGCVEMVKVLLQKGAAVKAADYDGCTPLHNAVWRKHVEIVKLLVERRATVNATDLSGTTPLHLAVDSKDIEILKLLLQKKAAVNAAALCGRTPLHAAVSGENVEMVKLLLQEKASVNAADCNGFTPLHIAVQSGHTEIVKLLLEKNAVVNATDQSGKIPLHYAVDRKCIDIAKLLLEKKALVNPADPSGRTPLHDAVSSENVEMVKLLLQAEAAVNAVDFDGCTPLHDAVHRKHVEIVQLLLEKKATVNVSDHSGSTPLLLAVDSKHTEIVKLLLQKRAAVNVAAPCGRTPLHGAVSCENVEMVRLLLQEGASVNAADCDGCTPLHLAVHHKHTEIVKLLLERNAVVNVTDQSGKVPLHMALDKQCIEIAKLLLRKKADVNLADVSGRTPLHEAVSCDNAEMVRLLLQAGAPVDPADCDGCTPLHDAVLQEHVEIVTLLLEKEAAVNAKDHSGTTPLCIALDSKHAEIAKLLLQKNAVVNPDDPLKRTPMHDAVLGDDFEMVKFLLEAEAAIVADVYGRTPLHDAVFRNHFENVELLLQKGASVNSSSHEGSTPLHIALELGNSLKPDILDLLLRSGADVNACDIFGETPLFFAMKSYYTDVAEKLIQYCSNVNFVVIGQDPNCTDAGFTALHYALGFRKPNVVKVLLEKDADVNIPAENGETALHIALRMGFDEIAVSLLNVGADVNAVYTSGRLKGYTPLHIAVEGHDYTPTNSSKMTDLRKKVIEMLLNKGANLDAIANDNLTPLHVATIHHRSGEAQLLIKRGANPNALTKDGKTVLRLAVDKRCGSIVQCLLEHCSNLNNTHNAGILGEVLRERFFPACRDIIQMLLAHGFSFAQEKDNGDMFYVALMERCDNAIVELLENGFDVNKHYHLKDGRMFIPLHTAVKENLLTEVRILIIYGADLNKKDFFGRTPISYTPLKAKECYDMVYLLLKNQTNKKNNLDFLITAVKKHRIDIIDIILKYETDINWADIGGCTPLHHAVLGNGDGWPHLNTVKFLLSKGANVNAQTPQGVSVLHLASLLEPKDVEVFRALLEHNSNVNVSCDEVTPLHLCALRGNMFFCQLLLIKGAEVNAKLNNGKTPLHVAVSKHPCSAAFGTFKTALRSSNVVNHFNDRSNCKKSIWGFNCSGGYRDLDHFFCRTEVINVLVNFGVEVNRKDDYGLTALHYAANNASAEPLRTLIKHKADISATSFIGPPLNNVKLTNKNYLRKINALVSVGADINSRDPDMRSTLLHYSAEIGGKFALELLDLGSDINALDSDNNTPVEAIVKAISRRSSEKRIKVKEGFSRHITKLKAANRYVDPKNLRALGSVSDDEFFNKCKREITTTTSRKVGKSNISYCDLLRSSRNQLVRLANHIGLVKALEKDNYVEKFPIYASEFKVIVRYLKLAARRKRLLDSSIEVFRDSIADLPVECVDLILDELGDSDLENLMRVAKPELVFPGEIRFLCQDGIVKDTITPLYGGIRCSCGDSDSEDDEFPHQHVDENIFDRDTDYDESFDLDYDDTDYCSS